MNAVRAVGRFLYEFVIGDDWKIAVAVVVALGIGLVLVLAGLPGGSIAVITAVLVALAFTVALFVDVRSRSGE